MNRLLWLLLNGLLLALAYGITTWFLAQAPADAAAPEKPEAKAARAERRAERRQADEDDGAAGNGTVTLADLEVLWQDTLFRPERRELAETAEAPAADAAPQPAANLELVGLARIGGRAVAVIMEHRAAPARPVPVVRAPGGAMPRVATAPAAAGADTASPGPPSRHVYKVGDTVGGSGYTVKDIRFTEQEVVLQKGNEERILNLDRSDDLSSGRMRTVTAASDAQRRLEEAAAKAAAAARQPGAEVRVPPPPPPVPPAMGVPAEGMAVPATVLAVPPGGGEAAVPDAAGAMSREERLERARELRERILQRRAQEQTN